MSKSRIPVIEQGSDDCVIELGGEEYPIHEGEAIWFVPYLPTPKLLKLLSAVEAFGDNDEPGKVVKSMIDDIVPIIVDTIHHWTWTSPMTGEPIGEEADGGYSPSAEDVRELSFQEQNYIVSKYYESSGVGEDEESPQ